MVRPWNDSSAATRCVRDTDAALSEAAAEVIDWGGGTRIGESLATFNRRWGRRVLGHAATVVIISDGWDRGDPDLLAAEMAHLQRLSHRLIWLNPLLGLAGYEPLTRGMRAALPYVDDFLASHNLASLKSWRVPGEPGRPSPDAWASPG